MDYEEFRQAKKNEGKTPTKKTKMTAQEKAALKRVNLKKDILNALESEAYLKVELSRIVKSTTYMVERELSLLQDEGVVSTAFRKTGGLMGKGPYYGLTSKLG